MVILFGAGRNIERYLEMLLPSHIGVKCIVDNDTAKLGIKVHGIEVHSGEELSYIKSTDDIIMITVHDCKICEQIEKQLKGYGYIHKEDYVYGRDYLYSFSGVRPGSVSGLAVGIGGYNAVKSADSSSRLYISSDKKKVMRYVSRGDESRYADTLRLLKDTDLLSNYVIDSWKSVDNSKEYAIEHEYIFPVSYCFEWSPEMFNDYVMFMIDFMHKLIVNGLSLTDGHHLNATVYKGRFIFIDFGAISPGDFCLRTFWEFISTHIIPLILMHKGFSDKAYMFLKNPGIMYTVSDIAGYMSDSEFTQLKELYQSILYLKNKDDNITYLSNIKNFILGLKSDVHKGRWMSYQDDEWRWYGDRNLWTEKMESFECFFQKVKPDTVIDLAGNMGYYGAHVHDEVKSSIIVDYDFSCIDDLWQRVRRDGMYNVVPIYMSLCSPTLDYYRDYEIGSTGIVPWRKNAHDRFVADMAIALAIVHHLAFSYQLTFREIIDQISMFTKCWLVIEFIEKEDQYIKDFIKDNFEWYNREAFESELNKTYIIVSKAKSTPQETRTMYLCKRKDGHV